MTLTSGESRVNFGATLPQSTLASARARFQPGHPLPLARMLPWPADPLTLVEKLRPHGVLWLESAGGPSDITRFSLLGLRAETLCLPVEPPQHPGDAVAYALEQQLSALPVLQRCRWSLSLSLFLLWEVGSARFPMSWAVRLSIFRCCALSALNLRSRWCMFLLRWSWITYNSGPSWSPAFRLSRRLIRYGRRRRRCWIAWSTFCVCLRRCRPLHSGCTRRFTVLIHKRIMSRRFGMHSNIF